VRRCRSSSVWLPKLRYLNFEIGPYSVPAFTLQLTHNGAINNLFWGYFGPEGIELWYQIYQKRHISEFLAFVWTGFSSIYVVFHTNFFLAGRIPLWEWSGEILCLSSQKRVQGRCREELIWRMWHVNKCQDILTLSGAEARGRAVKDLPKKPKRPLKASLKERETANESNDKRSESRQLTSADVRVTTSDTSPNIESVARKNRGRRFLRFREGN